MDDSVIDIERVVGIFMKIKAARAEAKEEFDTVDKRRKEQQDALKKYLLEHFKSMGMDSAKTTMGTVIRSQKTTYWTSDWERMHQFILEHKCPELLSKSVHQGNMREFLEENPELHPAGLNVDSEYTITIRSPRSKAS